ncbi:unnamed protein product [Coccothraustes coccothraustes]
MRRCGCPGWEDAGRSLDPPAPAGLRRLTSAASHRLASPAAAPGDGGGSDPSSVGKETASAGRWRARPAPLPSLGAAPGRGAADKQAQDVYTDWPPMSLNRRAGGPYACRLLSPVLVPTLP